MIDKKMIHSRIRDRNIDDIFVRDCSEELVSFISSSGGDSNGFNKNRTENTLDSGKKIMSEFTYRHIYTMAIVLVEHLKKKPAEEYIVIMDNS